MDLIKRRLTPIATRRARQFSVVSITGPRQSGKSTLAHMTFPDYTIINLENPQLKARALEDPVGFITDRPDKLIIDEAQYAPDLFSMIQVASDERQTLGQYILTGSQNFLLMKHITQSLAGRVGILKLLPLSYEEAAQSNHDLSLEDYVVRGGYPALYTRDLNEREYFDSYIQTYIERDVSELHEVRNLQIFRTFLSLCAQAAGCNLNVASLARDAQINVETVKSWLSILEASYIITLLPPYFKNGRKRLIKAPKLYFYDTGLLCYLLRIASKDVLVTHDAFGRIFENLMITETLKCYYNQGIVPELYYYRDNQGREVDLIDCTQAGPPKAYEIKTSKTYRDRFATSLLSVSKELGIPRENISVIMRSGENYVQRGVHITDATSHIRLLGSH